MNRVWRWISFERLWQDVRHALRLMRRSPGFTTMAVLSLALGIGLNTAIFSLVNTLMLRSLPVRDPGQLVELLQKHPEFPRGNFFPWQAYERMRDQKQAFSNLIAVSAPWHSVFRVGGEGAEPRQLAGEFVSGDFFPVLGIKPAIGRLLGTEDDREDAGSAVVSWSYWKSRFDLDPAIVGSQITVEDTPVTIVGVAPREFFGLQVGSRPDVWLPLAMEPVVRSRSYTGSRVYWLRLVGRLRPGATMEQAHAEMGIQWRRTIEDLARQRDDRTFLESRLQVEPASAGLSPLRNQFGKPLLLVMAISGLLLFIACTNVASMLLARGAARQREMATRVSLGANRLRLLRQVLTESLLLSAVASLLGVFLAYFGTAALVRIVESARGRIEVRVEPDLQVLLFAAAIGLLTCALFGLVPALRAMATSPASSLRSSAQVGETRFSRLFGKGLVATQVALSLVLLSAAGLFLGHLSNLRALDLGFARDEVLLLSLDRRPDGMDVGRLDGAYRELLDRLEAIPGVRSATLASVAPISGVGGSRQATVEGYQDTPGASRFLSFNGVAPKYFETLGMPLLLGRDFRFQPPTSRVAIVNQTMVRYYFGEANPIGRHFSFDGESPYEIVGVVGDAKYSHWRQPTPRTVYFNSFAQGRVFSARHLMLRTSVDPLSVAPEARRTVRDLFESAPVLRVTSLAGQMEETIVPERLAAQLSGLFGALGAVLAAIGIYGLLAYTVARRGNEIGIRKALGATTSQVTRMVLLDSLGIACTGLAFGSLIALWSKRFAASALEGLPLDSPVPIVFGAVALIAVALMASYVPGRRAARVDPMEALRHE